MYRETNASYHAGGNVNNDHLFLENNQTIASKI